jgi:hypothetical protein
MCLRVYFEYMGRLPVVVELNSHYIRVLQTVSFKQSDRDLSYFHSITTARFM